ncbi:ABC transporter ATP-binding protein [Streptomyces sp. URMC 127]|uniref:ABC transporter ATP-binding protein n=1 Tax=Streptomyces sp. URMC 127 TaxID=3423402 RepID=UPI003F1DB71C
MWAAVTLAGRAAPATLALYVAAAVASGALPVVTAWLTKAVLDTLSGPGPGMSPAVPAAGLALATGLMAVLPLAMQYVRAEMDRKVGLVAQDRLFVAVGRFTGLERFENPAFLDHLRLAQQAGRSTPNAVVDGLLGVCRAALAVGGFLGTLLLLSPLFAGLTIAAGIPAVLAETALSRRRARMLWDIGPAERKEFFYSDLLSSVDAAKEVRLFGVAGFLRARMLGERRAANAARRSTDLREALAHGSTAVLGAGISGAGLLWAVGAARAGTLSVGDVTVFAAAVAGVQAAVVTCASAMAAAHHALLMFDHYLTVVRAGPDLPLACPPRPLPPLRKGIELRDVWFRYSERHPWVLRGVSLHIPHGAAVALVGLNGAGKSTLVKLLCRFYDPTRGTVLWDGVDIRDTDAAELRSRITAVFQDFMQYDMTAAENIGLGDIRLIGDEDRITGAAQRAGVHEKLAGLPRGYDTLLTRTFFMDGEENEPEAGVVLSGGQWQRLALARAFLRDRRDLMILDEPSAGLDAEAEAEIHASLRRHRQGHTSLLVSHRLGAVREADHIVVLSQGRVTEEGDHERLMALNGQYAHLFTLQASGYASACEPARESACESACELAPVEESVRGRS